MAEENNRCPYCGEEMRLRSGRYGKFWECPNYPKCRFTCDSGISCDFALSKHSEEALRRWFKKKGIEVE